MLPAFNRQAESGIKVEPQCFIHGHSVIGFIHVTSSMAGNGLFAVSFLAPSAMPTRTQKRMFRWSVGWWWTLLTPGPKCGPEKRASLGSCVLSSRQLECEVPLSDLLASTCSKADGLVAVACRGPRSGRLSVTKFTPGTLYEPTWRTH